jgi:hypothetical protein
METRGIGGRDIAKPRSGHENRQQRIGIGPERKVRGTNHKLRSAKTVRVPPWHAPDGRRPAPQPRGLAQSVI